MSVFVFVDCNQHIQLTFRCPRSCNSCSLPSTLVLRSNRLYPTSPFIPSLNCFALQQKKKWEPPAAPTRVGKKQKKQNKGQSLGSKLPNITPNAKCKLRLLKLERVKDYLLMEEEFVKNQQIEAPQDEKNQEDRTKVY